VTAEPAGAAATAAFLQDDPQTGTFALLVTGANIAPDVRDAAQRRPPGPPNVTL
jgi:threonine dehydratase